MSKNKGETIWPERINVLGTSVHADSIAGSFEFVGRWANETGRAKGFWDENVDTSHGTKFALMHSELSEAFEALRDGNPPSEKIPGYTLVEEELADAVIRILDWGYQHGYDIGAAVISKGLYNLDRPYLHGKKF